MTTALRRSVSGFTLIEVMAVIFLTALVLGVALDYYYDLSNASQRAMDRTREVRRATAILDRVARDLQSATLVTKPTAPTGSVHGRISCTPAACLVAAYFSIAVQGPATVTGAQTKVKAV